MIEEGIIRPSKSPWSAQVLVTSSDQHIQRMVMDYLLTIYIYIHMINEITKDKIFSALNLCSTYH